MHWLFAYECKKCGADDSAYVAKRKKVPTRCHACGKKVKANVQTFTGPRP